MISWTPIPAEKTRHWLYDVSPESHVHCFQLASTRGSRDGPWSYVAFVLDPVRPDVLTACFATIDADALDIGANPFKEGYGISLAQDEGYGLIALLDAQIEHLAESQGATPPAFQLLKEEEYASLHIFGIASSYNSLEEHFYLQSRPHGEESGSEIVAILLFGKDSRHPHEGLYFKAMQFRSSELESPKFRANDYALPRIYLDRNDIRALVALFREHLR